MREQERSQNKGKKGQGKRIEKGMGSDEKESRQNEKNVGKWICGMERDGMARKGWNEVPVAGSEAGIQQMKGKKRKEENYVR